MACTFLVLESSDISLFKCEFSRHSVLISFLFHITNTANQLFPHINTSTTRNNTDHTKKQKTCRRFFNPYPIVLASSTSRTTTMPLLSVSNATVTELFKGSAKFGRPSTTQGAGWIATAANGNVLIQTQTYRDGNDVTVVRWTNFMELDGLNGGIIPSLPILRKANLVYFKTSSMTTRGDRHKAPFVFQFDTVEEAVEFEMWWLYKNGSIESWKQEDTKKKTSSSSSSNNLPLQETTNVVLTPVRKRKADHMIDGWLLQKVKCADRSLNLVCAIGGGDSKDDDENVPALSDGRNDDADYDDDNDGVLNPCVVRVFKTVGLMPTEANVNRKLRAIAKIKRSNLKSIAEDNDNVSDDDKTIDSNADNSKDSNDNDISNDSAGEEDVIIDEEDAPQSQNWMTAFASYE
jgi:hypothetical protein